MANKKETKAQAAYPMFKDPLLANTPEAHMDLATQITLYGMREVPVDKFTFLDPTLQGMLEHRIQELHIAGQKNLLTMAEMWAEMPGVLKDTFARYVGGATLGQDAFKKDPANFYREAVGVGTEILDSLFKRVNVPAYLAAQKEAKKKEGKKK